MFHQLTRPEFLAVRRALAAGMRHTEIARELDLSVWTISRIADLARYQPEADAVGELPEDDAPPDYAAQNLRRCPGCGAMVYLWPCIACKLATATPGVVVDEVEEDEEWEARS
jgi:hypothetical protein